MLATSLPAVNQSGSSSVASGKVIFQFVNAKFLAGGFCGLGVACVSAGPIPRDVIGVFAESALIVSGLLEVWVPIFSVFTPHPEIVTRLIIKPVAKEQIPRRTRCWAGCDI